MTISVIGCGYLGAVHAVCMASMGHSVVGLDTDEKKVEMLSNGKSPFFEPQLQELLIDGIQKKRLYFTTDASNISNTEINFISVGTPQSKKSESINLSYINDAIASVLKYGAKDSLIVGKSTVPVGTANILEKKIDNLRPDISLIWNPEFLREGFAINDTLKPDRVIYGLSDNLEKSIYSEKKLDKIYVDYFKKHNIQKIKTNYTTAELVKVSANSFLATKISFINAISEVCDATGADVNTLAYAIGLDERIGLKFLKAGIGFGGGCLPKDIRGFKAKIEELGIEGPKNLLSEVDAINIRARNRMISLIGKLAKYNTETNITILGITFKPNTCDLRESPALKIAKSLLKVGYRVSIYDPKAKKEAAHVLHEAKFFNNINDAVLNSDIILACTEWQEFSAIDPKLLINLVRKPQIVDGRNCLDKYLWIKAGFSYYSLGSSAL